MESITITKRVVNKRTICNKRFDDYDSGFYGCRISLREYNESKKYSIPKRLMITKDLSSFNIIERITYKN